MTAQHHNDENLDQRLAADQTDPIGPVTLPKRTKVGARAMALVGTVGLSAFAVAAATTEYCSTWPTIET